MAMSDWPMKNGDFPVCGSLPEGSSLEQLPSGKLT